MKQRIVICILVLLFSSGLISAQEKDTATTKSEWEFSADMNFYFFQDDFITLPVVKADKGKLHLEARYNYESENTFSAWGGYNISGGNKFGYLFTPMVGLVVGDINGIAPGLEMTLGFHGFELYSESEYFFDPGESENDFLYTWTDLTWSPVDWLWVGISVQRTRLYETDLDIQRGILLGGGFGKFELSGYMYNPGRDDYFFIAALSFSFR